MGQSPSSWPETGGVRRGQGVASHTYGCSAVHDRSCHCPVKKTPAQRRFVDVCGSIDVQFAYRPPTALPEAPPFQNWTPSAHCQVPSTAMSFAPVNNKSDGISVDEIMPSEVAVV